jgi:hypothetical protein
MNVIPPPSAAEIGNGKAMITSSLDVFMEWYMFNYARGKLYPPL